MRSGRQTSSSPSMRDQLAAALADDRVVGLGDAAVGLVAHDAQPRVVEGRQDLVDLRVVRAVEHDQDLEVLVVLVQAGGDRLGQVGVAGVGRDTERDTRGGSHPLPEIGIAPDRLERARSAEPDVAGGAVAAGIVRAAGDRVGGVALDGVDLAVGVDGLDDADVLAAPDDQVAGLRRRARRRRGSSGRCAAPRPTAALTEPKPWPASPSGAPACWAAQETK